MKKYFLLFSIFILSLSACKKGDIVAEQAAVDDAKIQAYIKANNLIMTKDPSGIYYQIITPGTGAYPTSSNTVKIAYTGTYLDGAGFDSAPSTTLLVSGFVTGFQIGITHINVGGRIRIIVPSGLAYGAAGTGGGGIPANACVIFVVDLLGFF